MARIRTRPVRLRWFGVLLAGLLALSGCGGGGGSAGQDDVLQIASATSSLSVGLALAAMSTDTLGQNGLRYEYRDFAGSSPNTVAALNSGSADVALVGAASGWDALQGGSPLVIVAALAGNTSELAMRTDVAGRLGITEQSPIEQRLQAMRGLTIATAKTGSANNQMLRSLLTRSGMNPDTDVRIVPSEPNAIVAGLKNGAIDAGFYGTGVMQNNYADGSAVPMISLPRGDVPGMENIVFAYAMVRADSMKSNPDQVQRFVQSLRDAGTAIRDRDSEVGTAVKRQWFPDLPQRVYDLSWDQVKPAWILDAKLTQQQMRASLNFQAETTGKNYESLRYDQVVAPTAR